ncbi:MAG: dsDNA nuclease domain-containing protein [Candidatus Bathyarchaeia archaeon]
MSNKAPDQSTDTSDTGDNTQNRFRYQAAYAAYVALQLLGESSPYECIYCEQYEDVLVKCKSGKFIGVQVKTKQKSLGPFRFGDDEILQSLKKFIRLDSDFPKSFGSFHLATNCGFASSRDSSDLSHALDLLQRGKVRIDKKGHMFSGKIETLTGLANCSKKQALSTLNKVRLVDWADLDHYKAILADDLSKITNSQTQPAYVLSNMAEELIGLTSAAACRSTDLSKPSYYGMLQNPQATVNQAIIENKRITPAMIENRLSQCADSVILLKSIEPKPILLTQNATKILERKMIRGGIDNSNIDLMKNNNWSAQYLFIEWLHKRGRIEAEKHADNLSVLVWNECQEAHDSAKKPNELYGERMLGLARDKLHIAFDSQVKNQYHEMSYPQLLGIAGILTEDCKIWWSERFDLTKEEENEPF